MDAPESLGLQSVYATYNPPHECGDERCKGLFLDFLLTVVLPSGIGLLLAFCLAICMCCSGSSRKRKIESNEEQFSRYDTVRRASLSLRQMSYKRDTPLMRDSAGGSMTLDRDHRHRRGFRPRDSCQSAPGTLQRHHRRRDQSEAQPPPPAYDLPPEYPAGDDNPFINADIPLHEMPPARGSLGRHGRHNPAVTNYNGYMTR